MTETAARRTVRLRPLTVVQDGEDVLIGDPDTGSYVSVPAVGGVVVRALQSGATLDEAAAQAQEFAGEPVDVEEFVAALEDLGFLADEAPAPQRTAPVQQRGWLEGPDPRRVRPLFSPVAWVGYGLATVWSVACFVVRPDLWPRPADTMFLGDPGLSLLILLPITYLLAALHESWHWLAARALGLRARFGVDRRLFFLVFETDLSQLWSVPRRSRYGPQLAGLAIDMVVLAVLLVVELVAPGLRLIPALVFVVVVTSLWQCMIFLRTDLYGVLVTATGCRDLWRVKTLLLRQAFGRLGPQHRQQLAQADPRDVRVGRWFRWVWLGGVALALGYFALFYLPLLVHVSVWSGDGLGHGPVSLRFWWAVGVLVLVYLPVVATGFLALRSMRLARSGA